MTNTTKKYETLAIVLLAIWIVYYLAVLLKTGFISDDAYNSQIKGAILQQGISLHDRILGEISGWVTGSGRFLVLGWYMTYGIYYVTQDTVVVKAITIAIILSGILLFYIFSKRETGSSGLALLACLIIPIFFQFRLWHDPILAFTFLIPIIFALTMGALVLFQKYLDQDQLHYYVSAAVLYLMALLMYEIAYPLCLLFLAIAYARSRNVIKAIKQSLPFTAPVGLLVVASAAIKWSSKGSSYRGADLHLDLGNLISAFAIQTTSSVPLSYYFFNKDRLATILYGVDYVFLSLFWIALATLIYKIGKNTLAPKLASWMICGAVLLFVPAALSSLSGHQIELNQVGYGFGYIPVYIQYFGLCIFAVTLLVFVANKSRGPWLIGLAIVVSAGLTVVAAKNLKLNRAVALKTNEVYKYPRQLLQSALKAGLANEIKDDAFLFQNMRFPSDYTWFYSTVTGKKFQTCELSDAVGYKTCIAKIQSLAGIDELFPGKVIQRLNLQKQDVWILSYNFEKKSGETGRVILGKVDRIIQNSQSKTPIQIIVSQIKIYDKKTNQIRSFSFENSPINFSNIISNQAEDMSEVASFDWASLLPSDVDFEWLGNIHRLEGTDKNNLRWSSGSANLTLYNLSDKPKLMDLSMALGTPTTPASLLSVEYAGKTEMLILGQTHKNYSRSLLLAPGLTELKFTSNAKPIQNGDPRNIVFGVFNFKIAHP